MGYLTNRIERFKYWEETGKMCFYCKKPISFQSITMDHVIPKSKNGKGTNENLVISCLDCNQGKADNNTWSFEELIKSLPEILKTDLFFRLLLRHYDVKITRKSKDVSHITVIGEENGNNN